MSDLLRPLSATYDPAPRFESLRIDPVERDTLQGTRKEPPSKTRKCAKLTARDIATVTTLTTQGVSARAIAAQIGFSRKTIHRIRGGWRPKINRKTGIQIHAEIPSWRVSEMHHRGMKPSRIALALGVCKGSVLRVIKRRKKGI